MTYCSARLQPVSNTNPENTTRASSLSEHGLPKPCFKHFCRFYDFLCIVFCIYPFVFISKRPSFFLYTSLFNLCQRELHSPSASVYWSKDLDRYNDTVGDFFSYIPCHMLLDVFAIKPFSDLLERLRRPVFHKLMKPDNSEYKLSSILQGVIEYRIDDETVAGFLLSKQRGWNLKEKSHISLLNLQLSTKKSNRKLNYKRSIKSVFVILQCLKSFAWKGFR